MNKRRQNSCDGKIKYVNEIAVQYHLSSNKLEGINDYYKCRYCGNFHVFTLPKKKKLGTKKAVRNYELRTNTGPKKMKFHGAKSGHKRKK